MKLFAILFLIPTLAFGAFTEFYCQSGGSNINSGSTTSNTAAYTSTNGNWSTVTNIFTPTDGSTPASSVNVGDFASIYGDGATVVVYIARVTAVAAGANGAITVSATAKAGVAPSTSATGRSIKVGGAWKGPNAAVVAIPLTLAGFASATDASRNHPRINFKNDASYLPTSSINETGMGSVLIQGYTTSPGDGGKATIDWATNTTGITITSNNVMYADMIFATSVSSGTADLVTASGGSIVMVRCVAHGARGSGFVSSSDGNIFLEDEAYDNNKANTASKGGFWSSTSAQYIFCISHDNTGSNSAGFLQSGSGAAEMMVYNNCISDSNGGHGFKNAGSPPLGSIGIYNCDAYNNGGDGVNIVGGTNTSVQPIIIRNSNFIKNVGSGINISGGSGGNTLAGFLDNNGYGAGTQANGSADVVSSCIVAGSVTYGSNLTPWVDPANGDFRINLAAANWAGRGAFTQTASSYTGTVGFPDIGAAQSKTGPGGTFSKAVSYGFPQ